MRRIDNLADKNRRDWLKTIGVGTIVGLPGCASQSGSESTNSTTQDGGGGNTETSKSGDRKSSYTIGISLKGLWDPFMITLRKTSEWYVEDKGHKYIFANAEGDPAKQNQQVKNMLNSGIDALLISPQSSKAVVDVIEQADTQGVPTFTYNSNATTDLVKQFVAFGNTAAGYQTGKGLAERLKESGGSKLLEIKGDVADQAAIARSKGFHDAITEEDRLEVVGEVGTDWSQQQATQKTSSYLQRDDDIDAIYAHWGMGAAGAVRALKQRGMKVEHGQEGHVHVGAVGGHPAALSLIREKYIDLMVDQPCVFYSALSLEYIFKYLDSGKDDSVLPSVDSTLKPDDIEFNGEQHLGVDLFSGEYWAPAKIVPYEFEGETLHAQLKTQYIEITRDNVDANYLWGNLADKY